MSDHFQAIRDAFVMGPTRGPRLNRLTCSRLDDVLYSMEGAQ